MPQYSWNIAKVGIKYQSIIINQLLESDVLIMYIILQSQNVTILPVHLEPVQWTMESNQISEYQPPQL